MSDVERSHHATGLAPRRLAAIDVGTNTVRLVVAEVTPEGSFRVIDDEKVLTRLGRGLTSSRTLDPSAMEASAEAVAHLRTIAQGYEVDALRAAATCAVREAVNGEAFVRLVHDVGGVELEVITPEEEARLAFLSVRNAFDLSSMSVAIADVGGGSTEVVLSSGEVIERIFALPIGAVRLTEQFDLGDAISAEQYRELKHAIRRCLRKHIGKSQVIPQLLIGTGGTFTNLASMSMHFGAAGRATNLLPFAVRGHELQRSELKHIIHALRKMTLRERMRVPGLNPDRADIMFAGLVIVDEVLRCLQVNRLRVHDQGIRAGMLYDMIGGADATEDGGGARVDRMRIVRRFAAACHHEQRHANHVADLSLQIFDELARIQDGAIGPWSAPACRELLHAAALLHDVGYLVNYAKHHKHTYHLIMHSGLAGFTRRELGLVANVARYHRGSRPKLKHAGFAQLAEPDRDVVRRLAGILRIAVGLDRSHTQKVRQVRIRAQDGALRLEAVSDQHPSVELWGAERKSGLFEDSFGTAIRFDWSPIESPVETVESV